MRSHPKVGAKGVGVSGLESMGGSLWMGILGRGSRMGVLGWPVGVLGKIFGVGVMGGSPEVGVLGQVGVIHFYSFHKLVTNGLTD